ncbi:glycosyl transferase family 1 [Natronococcus pandeyae]|uniref:Glycosyl transferase family 1 n=1 Tax=Natronococcus pandeyae TaxID=2055836 RepID=A0A8J8Q1A7_9EURY|nr:glycosyltransferase [Natronococcus pandeyae]TYL35924.1 glycosyl transferase family 1 [Natronococcus pandeyae]
MLERVAAFTDTYLPTVNGVTYTVRTWRDRWVRRGGRMEVVFPDAAGYDPSDGEHPVSSVGFPFYGGFRLGRPRVPRSLPRVDVVHAHTPFPIGLAALRYARKESRPLVASYHTPTAAYAPYVAPGKRLADLVGRGATAYERRFYDRADLVLVPSATTREEVRERVGVSTPVRVVPNGVDTERFRPVDAAGFRDRYDLPDGPLVGYTGRHGHEKRLEELLEAAARLETDRVTLVLGGDGPARPALERQAAALGVDARFLGVLDRDELPSLYAALDVFAFPSPVETQGLVALESIACGTPVVAADSGALAETVSDGETGLHYPPGDPAAFARRIERLIDESARFGERCLERRAVIGVDRSIARLQRVYASLSD